MSRGVEYGATIDADRMAALEEAIGRADRDRLLALLIDDLRVRPRAIRACCARGHHDEAARQAHSLRGSAAIVGADALIGILRALEQAIAADQIDTALVEAVENAARAVLRDAKAYYEGVD